MPPKRCTLKDVARAAKVSLSTASYALRNHPRIPARTCQRIQAIALKLSYRRDPHVSALMSLIGQGRPARTVEHIALVWPQGHRDVPAHAELFRQIIAGVTERAESSGYGVEQFWMEEDHLSGPRLSTILATRNIRGLLFAPAVTGTALEPGLDWAKFSTVVMGHARWTPEMHRTMPHHYHSMQLCLEQLVQRGAHRPAAVLSASINRRTSSAIEAAFLTHHPQPEQARQLIFFHDQQDPRKLPAWLKTQRVDGVIFGLNEFFHGCRDRAPTVLKGLKLVTMEWEPQQQELPGIHQRYDLIGMAAVDLLVAQLHINETGVPPHPRTVILNSDWQETGRVTWQPTPARPRKR